MIRTLMSLWRRAGIWGVGIPLMLALFAFHGQDAHAPLMPVGSTASAYAAVQAPNQSEPELPVAAVADPVAGLSTWQKIRLLFSR